MRFYPVSITGVPLTSPRDTQNPEGWTEELQAGAEAGAATPDRSREQAEQEPPHWQEPDAQVMANSRTPLSHGASPENGLSSSASHELAMLRADGTPVAGGEGADTDEGQQYWRPSVAPRRDALAATRRDPNASPPESMNVAEPVLFATTRVRTFEGAFLKSSASGFFFARNEKLFLVTNRHVLVDTDSGHFPTRIEIELHTDRVDLTRHAVFSIPLYRNGLSLWKEAVDTGGMVDVAVIEIETGRLPAGTVVNAFGPGNLECRGEQVMLGDPLTVIGFPLGFHDTIHHLAVARSASIASAYGVRFQQKGCFLTDARTHSGSSGAPVLRRRTAHGQDTSVMDWQLLGVHSTRMDMRTRDQSMDESLGLNSVWYADVLMALTQPAG